MRGVVTAADSGYFRPLQCLVTSLKSNSPATKLVVVNLGMTDPQVNWLRLRGIDVVPKPSGQLLATPVGHEFWQVWNKPIWIAYSGLEACLWLDADCVVLGPLEPILDELEANGSFAVRHTAAEQYPHPNNLDLYSIFPVGTFQMTPFNGGVIGMHIEKDNDLLLQWTIMCREGSVGRAKGLVTWQDEGALIWAYRKRDYGHRVLNKPGWNRMCGTDDRTTTDMQTWLDMETARWRAREPETIILHYGQCRFWLNWPTDV